ncbi:ABC transporter substrate-binding protein [Pandoraea sp.]|uniref:ABC transporter substrate-binding protein n=1 Tax=Pandoraea sp. TaxID=1883445 RepID=UPI001228CC64|nr:ABC transporter substrate-binding protein [Pandoraea sp.]TAL55903.1 MAG: ABC transporter substrate-binding protein [Pandoraea sp.]TAM20518.1 MAG: ABC transporter substrate-binding protein [Pandoraea sp.]
MNHLTRIVGATAVAIALGGLAGTVGAAEKITIMVGGINKLIYLPAILTERLGYFKQEGLDVDVVTEPAGVNAEDEMIAGAVQGVVGFYDHTIDLQSKGTEVVSLVQLTRTPGEVELVSTRDAARIRTPADLKGRVLGVTDLGSSTDFLTQYLMTGAGLSRHDYTMVAVSAGTTFIDAMRNHRIAAGMTTDPTAAVLLAGGEAKILVDLRTEAGTRAALGGDYPAGCLYMPSAWVESHRGDAGKLVRAFVKTLHYIHSHSASQIVALLPPSYYGRHRALYTTALEAFLPMFSSDGRMPADGPANVLRLLSTIEPSVKSGYVDLSKTYTSDFVDAAAH